MKFRDDIDPAKTWVTSDSHFGHTNIVGFCHRPADHDHLIMEEWARAVPAEDSTLLHLGDLAWKSNARFKNMVAPHLTGERKLLILGNHDKQRFSFYKQSGFNIVRPFAVKFGPWLDDETPGLNSYRISFSHYAWNEAEEGPMMDWDIRIHGHIHNNGYARAEYVPFLRNHINLSVEMTKYRPVNLKLLLEATLIGKLPEEDGRDWFDT
jgi:calcineurin-like phosphoesterase family protein